MFSQRKRFYQKKSFYGMLLVFLLAFGVWFNSGFDENSKSDGKDPAISVGEQVASAKSEKKDSSQENKGDEYSYGSFAADGDGSGFSDTFAEDSSDKYSSDEEGSQDGSPLSGENQKGPYYLLKEDGGYIKLYSVDESGEMQLLRTTDIAFSLLSETDQKLFEQGIIKQTKDELIDLLENFES